MLTTTEATMIQLRDLMAQGNILRNQDTGATYDLGPSQSAGPAVDYSMAPVEIPGYGKGYRLKGDPLSAVLTDGRIVRFGEDTGAARNMDLAQMQMQSERLKNQKAQQEIAQGERMASASGMGIPKLEKGEIWNADAGRVDSVPGSSRFITQQGKFSADKRAFDAVAMKTQGAEDKINEILGPKGDTDPSEGFKSNFGGYNAYLTQYMPGESSDTRKKIDSLKSDLRAAGLEMMRSGGSIGAMTEREWPIVEQMMAIISPVLSEPEAAFQLAKIKTKMQQIRNSAQEDFEGSWKNTQFGSSGQRGAAQATGVTVTTPDGKTLKFPSAGAADAFRKAAGL